MYKHLDMLMNINFINILCVGLPESSKSHHSKRQFASSVRYCSGCWWKCADITTHSWCCAKGFWGLCSLSGLHEQHHIWRGEMGLLRNSCRGSWSRKFRIVKYLKFPWWLYRMKYSWMSGCFNTEQQFSICLCLHHLELPVTFCIHWWIFSQFYEIFFINFLFITIYDLFFGKQENSATAKPLLQPQTEFQQLFDTKLINYVVAWSHMPISVASCSLVTCHILYTFKPLHCLGNDHEINGWWQLITRVK